MKDRLRLVLFAVIGGLFFSFVLLQFFLSRETFLTGLCLSNEYISRDES